MVMENTNVSLAQLLDLDIPNKDNLCKNHAVTQKTFIHVCNVRPTTCTGMYHEEFEW